MKTKHWPRTLQLVIKNGVSSFEIGSFPKMRLKYKDHLIHLYHGRELILRFYFAGPDKEGDYRLVAYDNYGEVFSLYVNPRNGHNRGVAESVIEDFIRVRIESEDKGPTLYQEFLSRKVT